MITVMNPNTESGIMKKLAEKLYSMGDSNQNKVLIISKYTERTRVNLILLKFFLQERGQRGIFITIDRPHQYIAYLLKLHSVCQKKLLFLDAVSKISGEYHFEDERNAYVMNGPHEVDFLQDLFLNGYIVGDKPLSEFNLKEVDFIMIDDVAALLKYQCPGHVAELITSYLSIIKSLNNVMAIIVLDVNKHKYLYKIIRKNSDKVILVNLSNSLVKKLKTDPTPNSLPLHYPLTINSPIPKVVGG